MKTKQPKKAEAKSSARSQGDNLSLYERMQRAPKGRYPGLEKMLEPHEIPKIRRGDPSRAAGKR